VCQRNVAGGESGQQCLDFEGELPGEDAGGPVDTTQRIDDRRHGCRVVRAVNHQRSQVVAQGTAGTGPAPVEIAFGPTASAGEVPGNSRAGQADRLPVAIEGQAGKRTFVTAPGADPADAHRLCRRSGSTDPHLAKTPCVGSPSAGIVGVVKEVLQLLLGKRALGRGLLVVLDMRGGVPFEEHLGGMGAESLFAHPIPAVVGIADIGTEQPQRILVAPHSRLLAALDGTATTSPSSMQRSQHNRGRPTSRRGSRGGAANCSRARLSFRTHSPCTNRRIGTQPDSRAPQTDRTPPHPDEYGRIEYGGLPVRNGAKLRPPNFYVAPRTILCRRHCQQVNRFTDQRCVAHMLRTLTQFPANSPKWPRLTTRK
jgi:hypothetical protein